MDKSFRLGFRMVILLTGLALQGVVMHANLEDFSELPDHIAFYLWDTSPFLLYFLLSIKKGSPLVLTTVGILLCLVHLSIVVDYFKATSSTAGLIFLWSPLAESLPLPLLIFVHDQPNQS